MPSTNTQQGERRAEHRAEVNAPAGLLYDLIADAAVAPLVFPTTVHVEHVQRAVGEHRQRPAGEERLRIWAAYGDELRSWTSRRLLRPDVRRVTFQQDVPEPPVASMRGEWRFDPLGDDRTEVTLSHVYRAVDDDPGGIAWIEDLADRVSSGQLAALRGVAALGGLSGEARVSFQDRAQLGCRAEIAYDYLWDEAGWAGRLPHVTEVSPVRTGGDMHLLDLKIEEADGTLRGSRVARVRLPGSRIAFKVLDPARPIAAHTGWWQVASAADGCRVTMRNDVAIRHDLVADALGVDAAPDDVRTYVERTTGALGRALLDWMAEIS